MSRAAEMNALLEAKKPLSKFLVNVAKFAIKVNGTVYKNLAEQAKSAKAEGSPFTLDDLYSYGAYLLFPHSDTPRRLEDAVLKALSKAVYETLSHEPGEGVFEPDRAEVTFKVESKSGTMTVSGRFDGSEYADEDGDTEVPTELQDAGIMRVLQKLGAAQTHVRWGLDNHHTYSDMGQVTYQIYAVWTFDPQALAKAALDPAQLKKILR